MSNFDPKKALVEEIQGLNEVEKSLNKIVQKAEQEIAEAEIQLNAVKKVYGFLSEEIKRKQSVLRQIIAQEKMEEGK